MEEKKNLLLSSTVFKKTSIFIEKNSLSSQELKLNLIALKDFSTKIKETSNSLTNFIFLLPPVDSKEKHTEEKIQQIDIVNTLFNTGLTLQNDLENNTLSSVWNGILDQAIQWTAINLVDNFSALAICDLQIDESEKIKILNIKSRFQLKMRDLIPL